MKPCCILPHEMYIVHVHVNSDRTIFKRIFRQNTFLRDIEI